MTLTDTNATPSQRHKAHCVTSIAATMCAIPAQPASRLLMGAVLDTRKDSCSRELPAAQCSNHKCFDRVQAAHDVRLDASQSVRSPRSHGIPQDAVIDQLRQVLAPPGHPTALLRNPGLLALEHVQ